MTVMGQLNAGISPKATTRDLSSAQCQLVEIGKALSMEAKIIVLDEPTATLTVSETETLFRIIQKLRTSGISIIFITHRLAEIFKIADRITILRDGAWVATEAVSDVDEDKIIFNMVGRAVQKSTAKGERAGKRVLLEVTGLSGKKFTNVSFKVHDGEIVGLFGLMGSGRTELVRAVFGADRKSEGRIRFDGVPRDFADPTAAIAAGIALVPEDRKAQGLVLGMPVKNNISLPSIWSLTRMSFIRTKKEADLADLFRAKLDIRCPSIDTRSLSLSGGNQQKVVIAKWMAKNPRLLIVDEPTRGIDVGAKSEVHKLMIELASQGVGVLMVSSELPEILRLSDRIYIMHEGALIGEVSRKEATEELIMAYASGQYSNAQRSGLT
jgi:ABC-type sugar transport system ATPase subunit